jgi:hypothetical protein
LRRSVGSTLRRHARMGFPASARGQPPYAASKANRARSGAAPDARMSLCT